MTAPTATRTAHLLESMAAALPSHERMELRRELALHLSLLRSGRPCYHAHYRDGCPRCTSHQIVGICRSRLGEWS